MMTVKKPDYSDDATDEDCIYDKTDEDKGQVRLPKQMNFRKNSKRPFTHTHTLENGRKNNHTSYLSILVHHRIIEVYKKYTS